MENKEIYRIMTIDGKFPRRAWGPYTELFYDESHAKRCRNAIKQFNKDTILVVEKTITQWSIIEEK